MDLNYRKADSDCWGGKIFQLGKANQQGDQLSRDVIDSPFFDMCSERLELDSRLWKLFSLDSCIEEEVEFSPHSSVRFYSMIHIYMQTDIHKCICAHAYCI